eukprot:2901742-Amphidinium_carterae.1
MSHVRNKHHSPCETVKHHCALVDSKNGWSTAESASNARPCVLVLLCQNCRAKSMPWKVSMPAFKLTAVWHRKVSRIVWCYSGVSKRGFQFVRKVHSCNGNDHNCNVFQKNENCNCNV